MGLWLHGRGVECLCELQFVLVPKENDGSLPNGLPIEEGGDKDPSRKGGKGTSRRSTFGCMSHTCASKKKVLLRSLHGVESPCLAYPHLPTLPSFPLIGCANGAPACPCFNALCWVYTEEGNGQVPPIEHPIPAVGGPSPIAAFWPWDVHLQGPFPSRSTFACTKFFLQQVSWTSLGVGICIICTTALPYVPYYVGGSLGFPWVGMVGGALRCAGRVVPRGVGGRGLRRCTTECMLHQESTTRMHELFRTDRKVTGSIWGIKLAHSYSMVIVPMGGGG